MTRLKTSVDLGYPTPAHGRIPSFNDAEEETAFWDAYSFDEFDEELTPTDVRVSKKLSTLLSVWLDPADRATLARLAQAKGIGPSTLIRMWVKEHLTEESEATPTSH